MALYNVTRFVHGLLKIHQNSPPSFTVRLYREYWTLNNGSKFLYNNQTASLLDDIRAQHIPVDFIELFDAAGLPFYEGCLIVELLDYRPAKSNEPELEKPERTRVVLTPNDESRWADICLMSKKAATPWSDADAVEVEARMLLATEPPLCLQPDVHLSRIVNATQRVSTPPAPLSLKRKAVEVDQEADELEKARRLKLMQLMAPQRTIPPGKYPILDTLQRYRQMKANPQAAAAAAQQMPATVPTTASPHPAAVPPAAPTVVPPTVPAVAPPAPAQAGPAPTSTPVPPQGQFHHPPPNAASPAPVSAASPSAAVPNIKKPPPKKKADGIQSPLMPRTSVTPAPAAPTAPSGAPLPIPPHLQQHYQAQLAARTGTPQPPVQPTPSPRPTSVVHATSPPVAAEKRPPSAVPPAQGQPVQQVQAAQPRPVQPSPAPPVQGQVPQQPVVPGAYSPAQIATAVIAQRNRAAAAARSQANGQPIQPSGATAQPQTPQQQQQLYYQFLAFQQAQHAQAQAAAAAAQQRLQPGQQQQQQAAPSPAQNPRSPMPPGQGQAPGAAGQRNSPMVSSQQIQPRSPMPNPNTPQQAAQQSQVQQQQQHAQQHPSQGQMQAQHAAQHHSQGAKVAYANYMRQYAAQQHPQMQQHLAAAGQPQQQVGQQQVAVAAQAAMANPQMLAQYQQMFNFPRMGVMPGQMPPGYWMGAGRGMPQNMAGMQGHPQQMQPGAAKPAQGQQGP